MPFILQKRERGLMNTHEFELMVNEESKDIYFGLFYTRENGDISESRTFFYIYFSFILLFFKLGLFLFINEHTLLICNRWQSLILKIAFDMKILSIHDTIWLETQ